jgi:hypothetical protein
MFDTMKQEQARAAAVNSALTHGGYGPRMPNLPNQKTIRAMVARLKKTKKKRQQRGGSVPKTYRRRKIRQSGGIVKQRRKPLNNIPTHYQYYQ